jgi:hypothetical protein
MAEKPYEWADGATLEDHSRRKHKILREYFAEYLTVRCKLPQQERFRLAIVDGFAGGGRYQCGTAGSPLIFVEELKRAIETVNIQRAAQGMGLIEIECLLILNDHNRDAIEALKTNIAPLQAEIVENVPKLHLRIAYLTEAFEVVYPQMKALLDQGRYRNVLFNLDQCGHSHVQRQTLLDIMRSYHSVDARAYYPQGLFGDWFWKIMKPDVDGAKHDWPAKDRVAFHHLTKLGRNLWILSPVACERLHLGDEIVRREHHVGALAGVAGRKRILCVTAACFA